MSTDPVGFQHGDELGYPAYCCPFCHEEGRWQLTRQGDVVTSWSCDTHLPLVLDSLQRREPGSTEIAVRMVLVACVHCGAVGHVGTDHTCPCPNRDGECQEHPTP